MTYHCEDDDKLYAVHDDVCRQLREGDPLADRTVWTVFADAPPIRGHRVALRTEPIGTTS